MKHNDSDEIYTRDLEARLHQANQKIAYLENNRRQQIELIRLHFAIQWRDNLPKVGSDEILNLAWLDADAFIKKSEA